MIDASKIQLAANNTFLSCGGADKATIEINDKFLEITIEGDNNEQLHREIKNFFIEIENKFNVPILNIELYYVSAKNNNLVITMPLK